MPANFPIEEVIKDLVDGNKSLVDPLMKLQYFAGVTKNNELLQFVLAELNGYKKRSGLPDYRTSGATISVDLQIGGQRVNDQEIPVEMLDAGNKEAFRKFYLTDSVAVLEQTANNKEHAGSQHLVLALPLTALHVFQKAAAKLYTSRYSIEVVSARILTNRNTVTTALTSIRSKLLSFCVEISDSFGESIAFESFNKLQIDNNAKITNIMNTTINNSGDGNVVNTGANANIVATLTINKGNKEQLKKKFQELGIDSADVEEISAIVDMEPVGTESKQLGNKTIDWISNISGKALKGVGSIAKEVSSSLLANLLMQYFGLPTMN